IMTNSINHTLFFPNPPVAVWEYLTNSELMELWLMKNDFKPEVGHDFQFRTNPLPNFNFDGIVYCKVLEIVPNKKLTYSWKGGPAKGEITIDTIVEWTLIEKDNGTELQLVHSGFENVDKLPIYYGFKEGWLKNMHKIYNKLNTAPHGTTNV
ncbi:MAG: SRPBCC domain-containing protein, partial [Parafilimonas sp.]